MKYDINRPRPTHGPKHSKYKYSLSMRMLICINMLIHMLICICLYATFEAQFMKKSRHTEAELKKALLIKNFVA